MTTITRQQFETACKSFIEKYRSIASHTIATSRLKGWSWNEHASIAGFGYMSRTAMLSYHSKENALIEDPILEEDMNYITDEALCSSELSVVLSAQQYVVYSPTFQVPAFYFTIHDSNGSPLPLTDLIKTSLFHPFSFHGTELTSFALSLPTSSFPLLSQGEHPTLAIPCWYFHPCETATSVTEVMAELQEYDWTEGQRLVKWIETWFMVLASVVDLRA